MYFIRYYQVEVRSFEDATFLVCYEFLLFFFFYLFISLGLAGLASALAVEATAGVLLGPMPNILASGSCYFF